MARTNTVLADIITRCLHPRGDGPTPPKALLVFQHQDNLGNAPAHKLFERVRVELRPELRAQGKAPRSFDDYLLEIDETALPESVLLQRKI
jgi:CRISPR-associated protein Csd2